MSRELNRRQLFDLTLNMTKKAAIGGGMALFLQQPLSVLTRKLLGNSDAPIDRLVRQFMDWDVRAEAATVPINYVSRPFLVAAGADPRDGVASLTVNSGSGSGTSSAVDNTTASLIKNGGSKNIQVDMTGSGGTRTHNIRWTVANNMSDNPTLGMRVYSDTGLNSFLHDACNNSAVTQVFRFAQTTSPNASGQRGWQYYQWFRDESTAINSPLWTSDIIRMNDTYTAANGETRTIYVDQMYYDGYQHPVIVWIFEGSSDTFYSVAFNAWTAYGLQGTVALATASIGGSNLELAEIAEMYAAGWDFIHVSDIAATPMTGLSVAASEARLDTADAFQVTNSLTRTRKVMLLPGTATTVHRTDANLLTALANKSYRYAIDKWADGGAAASSPVGLDPEYGFSLNPYRVPAWRTENPDLLAEYQFHVRHAVMAGGPRILRTGPIAGAGTSGQIDPADHTSLLAELALKHHAGTLTVAPWRKFESGLAGRVTRS